MREKKGGKERKGGGKEKQFLINLIPFKIESGAQGMFKILKQTNMCPNIIRTFIYYQQTPKEIRNQITENFK